MANRIGKRIVQKRLGGWVAEEEETDGGHGPMPVAHATGEVKKRRGNEKVLAHQLRLRGLPWLIAAAIRRRRGRGSGAGGCVWVCVLGVL